MNEFFSTFRQNLIRDMSSSTQYLLRAKNLVSVCPESQIRNICIIAHVDHGKTSLSDYLLASNQHVSQRQIAGGQKSGEAVRFLDSRLDEIDRQITIKSSCISLIFEEQFLVNLIDSPGHIDFAAEVSAAARLTDGAVIVVDAVEGVRAQTCSVIKQAWKNRIVPILFINKLDKLASLVEEFGEANSRIRQIVENVNLLFHDLLEAEKEELGLSAIHQEDLDRYQFDPVRGNVIFGSALHGWAFDIKNYTDKLVRPKLEKLFNTQIPNLYQCMYGEYALPVGKAYPTYSPVSVSNQFPVSMFTKFVIEQLWTLYRSDPDSASVKLSQMFPVADTVFGSVVRHVPSPASAIVHRSKLFFDDQECQTALTATESTVVFVVKHHPADLQIGCLLGDRVDEIRKLNGFVGVSRIFSGLVHTGQVLHVAGSDETVTIRRIYMLMGSSLVVVDQAVAGCVVAILLDSEMSDSGGVTLCSQSGFPPILSPYSSAQAIVRVTAEVKKSQDEPKLDEGLRLLARSDPAVVVSRHAQTGERIIGCCGDEHLARCIQDLEQLYAVGISVIISPPIVEIRESIASDFTEEVDGEIEALPAWLSEYNSVVDMKKRTKGPITCVSSDETASVSVSCQPIPVTAMEWIGKWQTSLRQLFHERQIPHHLWSHMEVRTFDACIGSVKEIMAGFGIEKFQDMVCKGDCINILTGVEKITECVRFGFHQACLSGPLAEEPVRGVWWSIIDARVSEDHPSSASSATALTCRASLLSGPVRISEPMLVLELQTENVKAAQTVLAQRRADIVYSDLVEGSYSEYLMKALLPASDAFKMGDKSKLTFSDELRGATHGKVVWRLAFSHWQVVNDSSPIGLNGVSHKLVCGVRKRKGLSIGEKVVVDADKQRTLTKMK
jgi:small GTP-binding protein